jgi:hypothetical protein
MGPGARALTRMPNLAYSTRATCHQMHLGLAHRRGHDKGGACENPGGQGRKQAAGQPVGDPALAGSFCPSMRACSMRCPETPVMSVATAESLMQASSSSFSSRCTPGCGVDQDHLQAFVFEEVVVKSVQGAVPVFRPVRFLGPLPAPAVRLSPQRALHKSVKEVYAQLRIRTPAGYRRCFPVAHGPHRGCPP